MILILLGPPGAGKGTQAKLLAAELRDPAHLDRRHVPRPQGARAPSSARRCRPSWTPGGLVPDDVTNAMVKERLVAPRRERAASSSTATPAPSRRPSTSTSSSARWGAPSTAALSYEVAEEVLVERISGRRSCPKCGAVYHVSQSPPKRDGFCDRDGAGLVQRDDDQPGEREEAAARVRHEDGAAPPLLPRARARSPRSRASARPRASSPRRSAPSGARGGRPMDASARERVALRSADEIARIREACRVVHEVLDELAARRAAGRHHRRARPARARAHARARRRAGVPRVPRLPGLALRLGERRGRPRHPVAAAASLARGRPGRARLRGRAGRLLRRLGAHGGGRAGEPGGGAAPRDDAGGARRGDRGGARPARGSATSGRRCRPSSRGGASPSCASSSATASAGGCTSRRRSRTSGPPGSGAHAQARHGARHRADGERRAGPRWRSSTTAGRR